MGSQISSATSMTRFGSGLGWISGSADLAGADADRVVQPAIGLAVGQVEDRPDDLAASGTGADEEVVTVGQVGDGHCVPAS